MDFDQRGGKVIAALAFMWQTGGVPVITEYPQPNSSVVAIEAIVKLPKMNPAQRYLLSQAINLAVQMTPEYANQDVLRILQIGSRFRLYQGADHLRVGLTVDPANLGSGLNLLHSVLTEPTFLADTIKARKSNVVFPWSAAYRGFDFQETTLERENLVAMWQGIMRPQNISVAISGTFRPGEPGEKWRSKTSGWVYTVPSQLPFAYPPLAKEKPNDPPLLVFDSKPLTLTKASLPSYLLAANALGVGKDSVQWLVAREGMNLSYRQEAFLIPTADGMRFRMAFATDEEGIKPETIAALRAKLRASCEALTQPDLDHAVGLGRGYLVNQMPTLPLILGIGEVVSNDANDQLYLRQYWSTQYGFDWNSSSLMSDMNSTKLEDFKKLLVKLIDESDVRIY